MNKRKFQKKLSVCDQIDYLLRKNENFLSTGWYVPLKIKKRSGTEKFLTTIRILLQLSVMTEIKSRKSVSQPLRPCRVDFCYINPLKKQQSQVEDPQFQKNTHIQKSKQNSPMKNNCDILFKDLKNSSVCEILSQFDSLGNLMIDIPRIKQKYLDDYQFLGNLGRGAYGRVQKLRNKQNECIYAGKTILKSSNPETSKYKNKRLQSQIKLYEKLTHSNIPELHQIYVWKNQYTLMLDYVEGSNLHSLVDFEPNQEQKIARIIYQILDTLEYLHSLNIVHHDIKPENIIFDPKTGVVKIVDFGQAIQMNSSVEVILRQGGTFPYFAPEHFQSICSGKMDIWACGLILYYLLDGVIYFFDENREEMRKKIMNKSIQFEGYNWINRSPQAKDLIMRMLEKDYRKRISASDAKKHPWILKNCIGWQNPSKILMKTTVKTTKRSYQSQKENQKPKQRKLSYQPKHVNRIGRARKLSRFCSNIVEGCLINFPPNK